MMPTNNLLNAPKDKELKLLEINSGLEAKRRLNTMGIHFSDTIIKLNNTRWGPVLIKFMNNGNSKMAIGRGLAKKIIVEYEE